MGMQGVSEFNDNLLATSSINSGSALSQQVAPTWRESIIRLRQRRDDLHNSADLDEIIDVCKQVDCDSPCLPIPDRLFLLSELGDALMRRSKISGYAADLDEAIVTWRKVIDLSDVNAATLWDYLQSFGRALCCRGEPGDEDEALSILRRVLSLTPVEDPRRDVSLDKLGCHLGNRFQVSGDIHDINEAIVLLREALLLRPKGHPHYLQSATALALAYRDRALERGSSSDLDQAISLYEEALEAHHLYDRDPAAPTRELALCHFNRFAMIDSLQDLDKSIDYDRRVLALQPPGHADRLRTLNSLYISLANRFREMELSADCDEAIALKREALSLISEDHEQRWRYLRAIGERLFDRSRMLHSRDDLDEAISSLQESITLLSDEHHSKPEILDILARALFDRYKHEGDRHGLDHAIHTLRTSMNLLLAQTGKADPSTLHLCIKYLALRYDTFTDLTDLEEEISLCRQLLNTVSENHPSYPDSLKLLGEALRIKYRNSRIRDGLDEATVYLRNALALLPADSEDQFEYLLILSMCISDRFKQYGDPCDMDEAVDLGRRALQMLAAGDPERAGSLDSLAIALFNRFQHVGSREDLDEAIQLQEEALSLRPLGHHNRPSSLTTCGAFLNDRYLFNGRLSDLDDAITMHREALSLRPKNSVERPRCMHNLAASLMARGGHYDRLTDTDEAIALYRNCLVLLPGTWERAGSLTNLASALLDRFSLSGETDDLHESKRLHREAVELRSDDDPDRTISLSQLGRCLLICYEEFLHEDDLDEAVSVFSILVQKISSSHEAYTSSLFGLYTALHMRAYEKGADADHKAALETLQRCVAMARKGSHWRPRHLMELSGHYHADVTRTEHALDLLAEALEDSSCPARERVADAVLCFIRAESAERKHSSKFDLKSDLPSRRGKLAANYHRAVRLLPQIAALDLSIQERLASLRASRNLCIDGASHFLLLDSPEHAIEILEEGRAVFWSQALRLRSEFDDLRAKAPHLAEELARVSQELNSKVTQSRQAPDFHSISSTVADEVVLERNLSHRRRLGEEFEEIVRRIRASQPGFDRFLLGDTFSSLSEVAAKGPVVVLLASTLCCRAIVIRNPHNGALQVDLPLINQSRVQRLGADLKEKIQLRTIDFRDGGGPRPEVKEDGIGSDADSAATRLDPLRLKISKKTEKSDQLEVRLYFEELWVKIVHPIIEALKFEKCEGRRRPRLWWCPTGSFTFLPLHAAGHYSSDNPVACSDYVVSSYTPTLAALRDASRSAKDATRDDLQLILASSSNVSGWTSLPAVKREIESIKNTVPSENIVLSTTLAATIQALPNASMIHLACHGEQDPNDALKSGFLLDGGRLTLSQLMDMQLPRAQFALLSACETAKGDKGQPDQTVHLAAAMMFVGFKSVVGTMWSMGDADGPQVAETVYKRLFSEKSLDLDLVPYALDEAISSLRQTGVSPARWATYIHIGI